MADYLAIEVLGALTDDVRNFILDSCLDESVCASLIDDIRHTHNMRRCSWRSAWPTASSAPAMTPPRATPGTTGTRSSRRTCADVLIADHPERATALHAAAAAWWTSVDAPTAIRHAVAAGDGDQASRIFADHWLELFLQGRVDAVLDSVDQVPQRLSRRVRLSPRQGHGLRSARQDRGCPSRDHRARALADLLPESDKARFDDRTALVELFCIGSDLGWGAAVGSGAALLERFDRSEQRPDPAVRASVQMFVGMAEARLENHVGLTLEMLRSSAATAHDSGLLALS